MKKGGKSNNLYILPPKKFESDASISLHYHFQPLHQCVKLKLQTVEKTNLHWWFMCTQNMFHKHSNHLVFTERYTIKGSITIRRTAIPSMLVNFSTFAFLVNFSFMK